jgi:hypothetical protein
MTPREQAERRAIKALEEMSRQCLAIRERIADAQQFEGQLRNDAIWGAALEAEKLAGIANWRKLRDDLNETMLDDTLGPRVA